MTERETSGERTLTGPTLVCIPTYNEAGNVRSIVQRVRDARADVHVLVVDDGSPDGTGDIADTIATEDPQVFVLHRTEKAGLGAAYLAAFAWGLERGYDVICEMDADGSHRPVDLGKIVDAVRIDGADLAIGARWVPGGEVVNWAKRRELLSRTANRYVRIMLRLPAHDATAGFRAFRASTLRRIHLESVASQGYCFQIDLTRRTAKAGLTITERPITFVERETGVSKMSGNIIFEALWLVTLWGVQWRWRRLVFAIAGRKTHSSES